MLILTQSCFRLAWTPLRHDLDLILTTPGLNLTFDNVGLDYKPNTDLYQWSKDYDQFAPDFSV